MILNFIKIYFLTTITNYLKANKTLKTNLFRVLLSYLLFIYEYPFYTYTKTRQHKIHTPFSLIKGKKRTICIFNYICVKLSSLCGKYRSGQNNVRNVLQILYCKKMYAKNSIYEMQIIVTREFIPNGTLQEGNLPISLSWGEKRKWLW